MSTQSTVSIKFTGDSTSLVTAVDVGDASLRKLENRAQATGAAAKGMGSAVDGVSPSLQTLNTNAQIAGGSADRLSSAIGRVGHYTVATVSLMAVAHAALATGDALFQASVRAQNLTTQLNFATNGNGARELAFVTSVADKLGLQLNSTSQAYAGFASASRGTALEGAAARAVFESMAKASAVMGLSADQSTGALLAVQQMMSKGVVSAEEFRGQLGERMPIALQAGAQALGVTTEEFSKLLESGQIVAVDFLPKFAAAIDTMLAGSVEDAANRLDASAQRMGNSWEKLKQTVGDSGVSSTIGREMTAISQDMTVASEVMLRVKASGGGMFSELAAGAGVLAGRTGFAGLNLAFNTVNSGINTLSGGLINLRTDLAVLPDFLKTNAVKAAELATELPRAEAQLASLQGQFGKSSPNIYIQDQLYQLGVYVDKLREAKREQAALTGAAVGGGRGMVNPQTVGAQLAQQDKDQAAANALRLKVSGVPEGYTKDMQEIIRLNTAGVLVGKEYTDVLGQMQTQLLKKTGVTTGANKAENTLQTSYASMLSTVHQELEAQNLELVSGRKLNDSDQLRIKWNEDLKGKLKELSAEKKALVEKMLDQLAAGEKAAASAKRDIALYAEQVQMAEEVAQALVQESKAREQGRLAVSAYVTSIREAADLIALELRMAPATAEQRALAIEHYKIELELKKQIATIDGNTGFDEAQRAAEYARVRAAAAQAQVNASNRVQIDGMRKVEDEQKKSSEKMGDQLTDALMRGFENSKTSAQNLRDTVSNMFNTMVLRPMISAVMNPVGSVVNQGMNAIGLGSGSSTGIGSILNTGSNIASLFGGNSVGNLVGSGLGWLTGATAANTAIGTGLGLGAASSGAAASAAAAAGGTTMMGTLGAAMPYVGLALAAVSLLKGVGKGESRSGGQYGVAFDGAVTNNRRGETYTQIGQQFNRNNSTGVGMTTGNAYLMEADGIGAGDAKVKAALESTAAGINSMLKGMGSSVALAQFFGGFETSSKGRGGVMSGGKFTDGTTFGESGTGDNYAGTFYEKFSSTSPDLETAIANFSQDLLQSSIQALQKVSDAPQAIKKKLNGVDAESLSSEDAQALLTDIGNTIAGVENLRAAVKSLPFENLRDMSFDAAAGLIELSGGIDNLGNKLGSYYNNFHSESERQANALKAVQSAMSDLGYASVDTRAEYRALYESQSVNTEAGRVMVAQLLQLESAFAAAYPDVGSLADAIEKLRNPVRSLDDIAKNIVSLQDKAWALENEGNVAAIRARELAALTDTERAIQLQIYALEDQKTAAAEVANAAADAAAAQRDYVDALASAGGGIASLVRELTATQGGNADPMALMRQRQSDYLADMALARQGDIDASVRVAQSARDYIDASKGVSTNATQAAINAQVISELNALPATKGYAQQQLEQLATIADLTAQQLSATNVMSTLLSNFGTIDINTDGLLTFEELQTALSGKASDAELRNLFALMDANGDGTISQLELVRNNTLAGAQAGQTLNAEYIGQSLTLMQRTAEQLATVAQVIQDGDRVEADKLSYLSFLAEYTARQGTGVEPMYVRSLSWSGSPGAPITRFAKGGAFTNSVVSRPTYFDMGLMGEAGDEAIMPLKRGPGGELGVRMYGRGSSAGAGAGFSEMLSAFGQVASQLVRVTAELAEIKRGVYATAAHSAGTKDAVRTLNRDGLQTWSDPKEPLYVREVIA